MARAARRDRTRRVTPPPATPVLEPLLFDLPLATGTASPDDPGAEAAEPVATAAGGVVDGARSVGGRVRRPRETGPAPAAESDTGTGAVAGPDRPELAPLLPLDAFTEPPPAPSRRVPRPSMPERFRPVPGSAVPDPVATVASRPPVASVTAVPRVGSPARPAFALEDARPRERLVATGIDLVVHVAVGAATVAGVLAMGVPVGVRLVPALLLFVAVFSFLYTVVPLVFWGHTPGMAWCSLRATDESGGALPFGVTVRRWLAAVATAATFGLPLLLVLRGDSLGDRLSGSRCYRVVPAPFRSRQIP